MQARLYVLSRIFLKLSFFPGKLRGMLSKLTTSNRMFESTEIHDEINDILKKHQQFLIIGDMVNQGCMAAPNQLL